MYTRFTLKLITILILIITPGSVTLLAAGGGPTTTPSTPAKTTTVLVTEKVPGAECKCVAEGAEGKPTQINDGDRMRTVTTAGRGEEACKDPKTRKYECTVGDGLSGFQDVFREIVRWFVYITMLLGVVAIVGAGILWSMGSDSEEYTKKAKGWVKNIIIGLIILFTFGYILRFLAPWIFQ